MARMSNETRAELHTARRDTQARIERLLRSLANAQTRLDALDDVLGVDRT